MICLSVAVRERFFRVAFCIQVTPFSPPVYLTLLRTKIHTIFNNPVNCEFEVLFSRHAWPRHRAFRLFCYRELHVLLWLLHQGIC